MKGRLVALALAGVVAFTACGLYMFHPHQHWLADKGAMGWFAAV